MNRQLRVLVACERSQIVTAAFRDAGCEAYSADIELCLGEHPEWHIIGDVSRILNGHCQFTTETHVVCQIRTSWDIIIAHPPCTYLSKAGSVHLYNHDGSLNLDRMSLMRAGRLFFLRCLNADCPHICVENPVPVRMADLPQCSTIINPSEFGHPFTKRTCLWLKNLPPLIPTMLVSQTRSWVNCTRGGTKRSQFWTGIAQAMAAQWVPYVMKNH